MTKMLAAFLTSSGFKKYSHPLETVLYLRSLSTLDLEYVRPKSMVPSSFSYRNINSHFKELSVYLCRTNTKEATDSISNKIYDPVKTLNPFKMLLFDLNLCLQQGSGLTLDMSSISSSSESDPTLQLEKDKNKQDYILL